MGDRIYSLANDMDYELVIRTWEIVDSTPKHYDISPREIPNKDAMKHTRRIRQDDMCAGVFQADYYWTKEQLLRVEIKHQQWLIMRHESSIVNCKEKIGTFEKLEESLPHYER